ncbi:hypothetical protein FBUS_03338 [Fasciolopsis buskii]|uniref:Uncharacterized protein n=1 Tax=Fasciolopsis buskii TaxID=27845 RepID=A0A8E0S032_9TREM|nr:hypothetical protein FBUS_03338 [Fasciolopsis buski]
MELPIVSGSALSYSIECPINTKEEPRVSDSPTQFIVIETAHTSHQTPSVTPIMTPAPIAESESLFTTDAVPGCSSSDIPTLDGSGSSISCAKDSLTHDAPTRHSIPNSTAAQSTTPLFEQRVNQQTDPESIIQEETMSRPPIRIIREYFDRPKSLASVRSSLPSDDGTHVLQTSDETLSTAETVVLNFEPSAVCSLNPDLQNDQPESPSKTD